MTAVCMGVWKTTLVRNRGADGADERREKRAGIRDMATPPPQHPTPPRTEEPEEL